jgi:type I restriction enzyme M protein
VNPVPTKNLEIIVRKDLIKEKNLKHLFRTIRNHLAGNFVGTTRDERLAEQLIFLLFCKLKDETERRSNEPVQFQINFMDNSSVSERIHQLFTRLKKEYHFIFDKTDELQITDSSLSFIVEQMQIYSISEARRDVIGDAFEIFLGPSLRGNKGQFFTPKNIANTMIEFLDPQPEDTVIDPACGSGGFLTTGISKRLDKEDHIQPLAPYSFFGIEKDEFLAKISRLYLAILGKEENVVFCENSLDLPENWEKRTTQSIKLNNFDIVCTNPPFGAKIPISTNHILQTYHLGRKWKRGPNNKWIESKTIQDKQPPQILFLERCLDFLKEGGRMGIVLPDGIFGNPSDRYIIQFLFQRSRILAIISCSPLAFLPYTHTKTSLLFVEKLKEPSTDYSFFMAIANNVGHDKNGKTLYLMDKKGDLILDNEGAKIVNDDFPKIVNRYKKFNAGTLLDHSHLGFTFNKSQIFDYILIPEFYNPEIEYRLLALEKKKKYTMIKMGELVSAGVILIKRGHEIGSKFYGTGDIPFIRTSDLINWELNIDPKKRISREVYNQYKDRQDIKSGDILFVSDGTFLIGKTAMITENDTEIIIQSHLKQLRVLKKDFINEYLLLWVLNSDIVQEQIKAKTFIQSTISTLGNRLIELILPIPIDPDERRKISQEIEMIIKEKMSLNMRIQNIRKIS